jgi:ABC-type multidrug transport system ATPase subunit
MSFLSIQNVSRAYDKVQALDDFSLAVEEGQIVALVGPDGAGKTTLIRIICHLLDADKGLVSIGGMDVAKDFDKIKPLLGYMPQTFSLYPDLSIEENLTFYAGIYGYTGEPFKKKREELYRFSQLGPFAKRRAGALSGGMKQKLALSCALLHDPKLLVLDEPTTGVDPLSRRYFWEMLGELKKQGSTILVSTPYMDEAERSDKTSFIFAGKKLIEGPPSELAAQYQGDIFYVDREPTTELVYTISQVDGLSARRFGTGMNLYVDAGRQIGAFGEQLQSAGIDVGTLQKVPPTIEDRFIQLMEERT